LLLLLAILLLSMSGCNPDSNRPPGSSASLVSSGEAVNEADRQRLMAEGRQLAARAANSPPPLRDQLYMRSAEAYLRADDIDQAAGSAALVSSGRLPPNDLFDWNMLSAEINMKRGSPGSALSSLAGQAPEGMSREQLKRYYRNLAEANRLSGNMLESARARTELDSLLSDPKEKIDNQLRIIKSLTPLSDTALELLQPSPPGTLGGWMELARVFKKHGEDLDQAKSDYQQWRGRFPDHPAAADLYASHYGKIQSQYRKLDQIAVMLPQSGPLKNAGAAIRNGIMAAYYAEPAHMRPSLKFYDSSNLQTLGTLYEQASAEGAVAVIGPLDKKAVAQLASGTDLSIPTIALNRATSQIRPPRNLYQFALAPEDEARQAAERAWHDGHTAALAMVPDSTWGRRVLEAFRSRWTALGGSLPEHVFYKEKSHDFSKDIRNLLNINTSVARHKEMQRKMGRKLAAEPTRRTDAQIIFLAASPEKAREIRPQLQFNFAGDMPVYATSRVFSGVNNIRLDRDLTGIRFPDHPWLLVKEDGPLSRKAVAKLFPSSRRKYPRLHSMGIDSYNLLPRLEQMSANPGERFDGKTGILHLDRNHQVRQQLLWAEMQNGRPKVLGYVPESLANSADPSPPPLQ
jgi:outer membrane PBP1 activator LpoA protein